MATAAQPENTHEAELVDRLLDEEVRPIHHQLLLAFSHSNRAMLARTSTLGLKPGQPKVLEYVIAHEGCTQREIAAACVMDKSTVTGIVTRMETEGLVERRSREGDRRIAAIWLTERGREAAERVLEFCDEVDTTAWAGMSREERAALSALIARVIANLEKDEKGETR